ncbi:glycosyltransferase family 2 protein [Euryhalocaulis caribicus]|uniref:glycosyltransferase family 2 protein n=1 Tax=Euryhalocaulis caribicus TaxID=1161401 RepID=UPI0003A5CF7C|nr:glycosyltransferase family A protein [Euryhalocaulis caribicus]
MSEIRLSVLVPFYKDDPTPLIADMGRAIPLCELGVELVLYDDGTADETLTEKIENAIANCGFPARLVTEKANRGRAEARNALVRAAKADKVLFLDADMRFPDDEFLSRWTSAIVDHDPDIAFGGFEAPDDASAPQYKLHQAFSRSAECAPAVVRAEDPARHLYTSNLLVRKSVLAAQPFDAGFAGWGWEDMEWAARAAHHFTILHIQNPAIHAGLETEEGLLDRYQNSGANYARFVSLHPDIAARMPLYRWAKLLRRTPGQRACRPVLSRIVRAPAPVDVRVAALKLWRASWYGDALP